jgi:membrane protein DedA with SNARE-associated domain
MERVCIYSASKKRKIEIIDILVILIILAFSIFVLIKYNILQGKISEEIAHYGLFGVFSIAFLFEMFPQLWHPFAGVALSSSIGISLFYATIFAILGSTLGSILGFEVGRKYGFGFVCPLFSKKSMTQILSLWDKHGALIVLVSALSPIPYVPIIFGALGLKRKAFLFYGVIPRILSFIFLGFLFNLGINLF